MPSNETAKTKSALNWRIIKLLIGVGAALLLVLYLAAGYASGGSVRTLTVNREAYRLQVASTPAAQEKGLGDRKSMDAHDGMLFPFPAQSVQCFWMKGMEFPLDIIWLSSDKKIVRMQQDLQPESYPNKYCAVSQYVIELSAGRVAADKLAIGQTLNF